MHADEMFVIHGKTVVHILATVVVCLPCQTLKLQGASFPTRSYATVHTSRGRVRGLLHGGSAPHMRRRSQQRQLQLQSDSRRACEAASSRNCGRLSAALAAFQMNPPLVLPAQMTMSSPRSTRAKVICHCDLAQVLVSLMGKALRPHGWSGLMGEWADDNTDAAQQMLSLPSLQKHGRLMRQQQQRSAWLTRPAR
jgi:hypothetical protein